MERISRIKNQGDEFNIMTLMKLSVRSILSFLSVIIFETVKRGDEFNIMTLMNLSVQSLLSFLSVIILADERFDSSHE